MSAPWGTYARGPVTDDGRPIVVGDERHWCARVSSSQVRGFCFPDPGLCKTEWEEQTKLDYFDALDRAGGHDKVDQQRRAAIATAAIEQWTRCAETTEMGCMRATHVLSGRALMVCFPTLAGCEHDIDAVRRSTDYRLTDDRCIVYRVR
jgi:hypothetical protein